MKKYSYTTVKLVLVLLLSAPIASALTVEEVLSAMPPDNAASASLLFDKAFEEGPALIKALCARITPSADGVEAEAKFALYGLAKHAGRPGSTAQRTLMARILEEAVRQADSGEVKSFFLSILNFCADDASVAALAAWICDGEIALDVIRAIESIGGDAALTALSLADCPEMQEAIAQATARLQGQAPYTAEAAGLSDDVLRLVLNPDACENKTESAERCRELLVDQTLSSSARCMVLRALVTLIGKEALPELIAAQTSPDRHYQGCARELVRFLPGEDVSQAWTFRLSELDNAQRAAVISLLGERSDASARNAVFAALRDGQPDQRIAACEAVSASYGASAVSPLLDAFETAETDAELQAVKGALLRVPNLEEHVLALASADELASESFSDTRKIICLDIIAERNARNFKNFVLACLEDADGKVQRSAFSALAVVGNEEDLTMLFDRLQHEQRDAEAEAASASLVSLADRLGVKEQSIARAAELLGQSDRGTALRLIRTLAAFGTAEALAPVKDSVSAALASGDVDAKWARNGLEVLAVWPLDDARNTLLDLWKGQESEDLRKTALKCYITSVQRTLTDKSDQIKALREAKEFTADDSEKRSLDDAASKIRGKK